MINKSSFAKLSQKDFANAKGFPHLEIKEAISVEMAKSLSEDFNNLNPEALQLYSHFNAKVTSSIGRKYLSNNMLETIDYFQSPDFLKMLETITGLNGLRADKGLAQGGILNYPAGNFVNLHTDNLTHPFDHSLKTALTVLLYLNEEWEESYNGALEIWDNHANRRIKSFHPSFNKMVILKAGEDTIHGLPEIINCPKGMGRKAIVLWYYQKSDETIFSPTKYYARPQDPISKKLSVFIGNQLLKVYYFQRRFLGDWDYKITKVMKLLSR
ncbi:MAG: 2OG-Fe(II) oxygenase [Oligoflexia bacterium]|nr:2OG-Fe(II) oxygenase [Oligoflexia bacterium]